MHRLLTRTGAIVAAAAASLALTSFPANAATRTFHDAKSSDWWSDLTRVKVNNGTTYLTVTADVGSMTTEDRFYLWVDTDVNNAGPEYKGTAIPNSEWQKLRRVGSFSDSGKALSGENCWVMGTADVNSEPTVTFKVKRSCMKQPGKIRVAVKARYQLADAIKSDWGPGKNEFFGWVAKG
ncbi:hypothetical protein SAMN04488543_2756 [Friedmanniella luteola]|uniref:Uncharacterized protein n=1 Tax=Friedmanniella luteola TaxID=546871 RepID=A0A1H1WLD2_9ACTN|nr:hypothetical protein [Friedmanniella luteola]SDS97490.1 hypothetical protein SAMN04488543_2756 [Friedmanniella luteola]